MGAARLMPSVVQALLLTTALWSPLVFACSPGEANCACNESTLEVDISHAGPQHPYFLNETVVFRVSTNWTFNTSVGVNLFSDSQLLYEAPRLIDNDMECGMKMIRTFRIVSGFRGDETDENLSDVSKPQVVDVVMFVDNPLLNPLGGYLGCDNEQCKEAQIHYHFPPAPDSIHIQMSPDNAMAGDAANISCTCEDGHPLPEMFTIRVVSLTSDRPVFSSAGTVFKDTLYVEKLVAGWYFCQAISFPLGSMTSVTSLESIKVAKNQAETEPNSTVPEAGALADSENVLLVSASLGIGSSELGDLGQGLVTSNLSVTDLRETDARSETPAARKGKGGSEAGGQRVPAQKKATMAESSAADLVRPTIVALSSGLLMNVL